MTYSNDKDKPILDQAQEYFESIDNSENERSDEEVEQDNQKAQEWIDEIERLRQKTNNS